MCHAPSRFDAYATRRLSGAHAGCDSIDGVRVVQRSASEVMPWSTDKRLADLIRGDCGVKVTVWVLVVIVLGDLRNTASEFAGVASAAPIFQTYVPLLSKYVLVPLAAVFVATVVTRGNYRVVEKIFFAFCFVYLAYVVSGFLVHRLWGEVRRATFIPHCVPTQA